MRILPLPVIGNSVTVRITAGRLYGASGLWLVDRPRLNNVSKQLATDPETAPIAAGGCEIRHLKVSEVFKSQTGQPDVEGGKYPQMMAQLMQ